MIPILTYHQIADAPAKPAPYRSLYVSPGAFSRQMKMLQAFGYRGLGMEGLLPYLRGEKQGKVVGITFDDGFLNNFEHAAPVLQELGFSSTCYLVSRSMGGTNAWDCGTGVAQVPLMNASQARAWVAAGQEVGAHSQTHAHLNALAPAQAQEEIAGCRRELEDAVGCAVRAFCYPYGEYGDLHARMAAQAGFTSATTTRRGRCRPGEDLMRLPRVPVLRSTALPSLALKLVTRYEDRRG